MRRGTRELAFPHHLVHPLAALDALELLAAGVAELDPGQGAAHGAHYLRHQDLPALGPVGDAGGQGHGGAEVVARLLDGLARIQADADAYFDRLSMRILVS